MNQITLDFFEQKKEQKPKIPLRAEGQSIEATTIPIYVDGVEVARIILSSWVTRIEFVAFVRRSYRPLRSLQRFLEKLAAENGSKVSCEEDEQGFLRWFDLKPPLKSINVSLFTRRIANAVSRALGGEK